MKTLLDELPKETLGYPLGGTLKIILYFLIPPILLLTIYLCLIAADITLIFLHIEEDNPKWATTTLLLICWPAAASFMFTIASPSLWPGKTPLAKENLKFLATQLLNFTLFPIGVSYRYIYQIFWAIEAMFASLRHDEIRREEALKILMKPNTMELYFVFQAYLHCAPQILLQFYIMLRIYRPYSDTVRIQLLSIAACLLKMSVTTMSYMRFERRKVLGAQYPWSIYRRHLIMKFSEEPTRPKPCEPELISNFVGLDLSRYSNATTIRDTGPDDSDEEYMEPIPAKPSNASLTEKDYDKDTIDDKIEKNIDQNTNKLLDDDLPAKPIGDVDSDNEFYNDDVFHRVQNSPPPDYQDEILPAERSPTRKKFHVSIIENEEVERRRKNSRRSYNIVDMSAHVTPPAAPAPRFSFHTIKDRIMNNAETIMDKIPQRNYKDNDDFDLPVRVRENAIKGIAQEDAIAKFVAFMSWWLFITARMLAIASFSFFYFESGVYVCISHYLLMLSILMCNSWKEDIYRKFFYLFLAYIYLFCLIEFKMTFIKVRLWYGLYFALVMGENFIMTALWYWNGSWDTWWFGFIGLVIVFSSFLSLMCFLCYFLILKPRPMTVYPLVSSQSCSPATIN